MKATKFFPNSEDMASYATEYRSQDKYKRWYFRTTLKCNHRMDERRKAIVLVDNETIVQRLITCKVCNNAQNSANHG